MAENSKIAWTDHTQNFWVGCQKVSAACDFCYAENWAKMAGRPHLWAGTRERTKDWRKPKKWDKEAELRGYPYKIFTNSLADFFDNQAEPDWRHEAWAVIRSTPHLQWLILTKRPQNIAKMLPGDWDDGYPNVWLGTTAENQEEYDRRRMHLFSNKARVHFFSVEPMQSPIIRDIANERGKTVWYICGGESGPNRRPFEIEWAESLWKSCAETQTAFFFKQDSALKPGQQGRASDALWNTKQFPDKNAGKSPT
jgi:protein gp37